MELFAAKYLGVFGKLALSALLGMLLGAERSLAGKVAGMRTYAMVSLGSCLFVVTSVLVTAAYAGVTPFDPMRMAAGIVTGIGFLGAGVIIFREKMLQGLTTAAGLWVAAGIGIAVGFGLTAVAVFATALALVVFTALWHLENRLKRARGVADGNGGDGS